LRSLFRRSNSWEGSKPGADGLNKRFFPKNISSHSDGNPSNSFTETQSVERKQVQYHEALY
jgi:hypothetical protein